MSRPFALGGIFRGAFIVAICAAQLTACASQPRAASSTGVAPFLPQIGAPGSAGKAAALSGRLPRSDYSVSLSQAGRGVPANAPRSGLFVSMDSPGNDVSVFHNKTWKNIGSISAAGMGCPSGDWIDKSGNLYVADFPGGSECDASKNVPGVYEFTRGASQPSFVYSSGISDAVNVTADEHGNVYVMDYLGGYLDEFRQGVNAPLYQCPAPSSVPYVIGAAVDPHGNVFVVSATYPYYQPPWSADLYEYAGGLNGCTVKQLATFSFLPGGMVLDRQRNLLLVDQIDNAVDVIPPPYTSIASQIAASNAFMVTINRKNSLLFITDYSSAPAVLIDAYPSGSNVATLGPSDGISNPGGAVDSSNYIP